MDDVYGLITYILMKFMGASDALTFNGKSAVGAFKFINIE